MIFQFHCMISKVADSEFCSLKWPTPRQKQLVFCENLLATLFGGLEILKVSHRLFSNDFDHFDSKCMFHEIFIIMMGSLVILAIQKVL